MLSNFLNLLIFFSIVILSSSSSFAATPKTVQKPQKQRVVLMPIKVSEEDRSLSGAMETALVEGLQERYIVFSGDRVQQKTREIFLKESKTAKSECDETKCMEDIAIAFQAELIAVANVTKRPGGYFLSISIQNIFDNKVVYSKSLPCKGSDDFEVIEKLKELGGIKPIAVEANFINDTNSINVQLEKNIDQEKILWDYTLKANNIEAYDVYLNTYPHGKYITYAKSNINKLNMIKQASLENEEKKAWDEAIISNTSNSYSSYLNNYPNGKFSNLAQASIKKLLFDQKVQVGYQDLKNSAIPLPNNKASKSIFKDCPTCPKMVTIPAGEFLMGSSEGSSNEREVHRVNIRTFALGINEITQGEYKALMGSNPSYFKTCGDSCPVEQISWNEATEYAKKLSARTGHYYRLPSEAEWEYAARAGTNTKWYCGNDENCLQSIAWYKNNSTGTPHPVGQKIPNVFGLYDMSGNVQEWMQDWYNDNYANTPRDGSANTAGQHKYHSIRGGSWFGTSNDSRLTSRDMNSPDSRDLSTGFRLLREY